MPIIVVQPGVLGKANQSDLDLKQDRIILRSVTLPVADWDLDTKSQTVTVPGISADETKQRVTWAPSVATRVACDSSALIATDFAADSLTFTVNSIPVVELTVFVTIEAVYTG